MEDAHRDGARPALPPDGLPVDRLLSGTDDEDFCRKVSAALERGYQLHAAAP